jgi:hypothetical protein
MTSSEPSSRDVWPASPYKGLSFYGPRDAPLLAGRDDDVESCARLIAHTSTRMLILHGLTGCGKSSFLRAGLIPLLERGSSGFRFLRELPQSEATHRTDSKALFIRCTSQPLDALATSLTQFILGGMTVETPLGLKILNLRKALPPGIQDNNCVAALSADSRAMLGVLERLSGIVPQTLTLVIDQGEELLTLDQSPTGEEARHSFLEFLGLFTRTTIDLKLVLALRTEYYGRIYAKLRRAQAEIFGIREYFLDELTTEQLVQAIIQPTSEISRSGLISPREFYKFTYEKGLPEKIVGQLSETAVAGGILPVLQIVCSTLWDRARRLKRAPFEITSRDYDVLGGPAGQVEEHLDRVLQGWARQNGMAIDVAFAETDRWKAVLHRLVRTQADGSVTTDIVKRFDLVVACSRQHHCRLNPIDTLNYLATDQIRVLREVYVVDRRTRENTLCYSLGHDTLGLVLRRWKLLRDDAERSSLRLRKRYLIIAVCLFLLAISLGFAIWKGLLKSIIKPEQWKLSLIVAGYALTALLGSLVPRFARSFPSPLLARLASYALRVFPPAFARSFLRETNKTFLRAYPDLRRLAFERAQKEPRFYERMMDRFFDTYLSPFFRLAKKLFQLLGD